MIGLYDRDYFTVTPSERAEEERLSQENTMIDSDGIVIIRNYYSSKPKAIRHYESLFPNNYLDTVDLKDKQSIKKQYEELKALLNNKTISELDVKRFIQNNKYYTIPASSFHHYSFGHHDAYLFKEFQLGTSYKADYLLVGKSSMGYQFIFVEYESPYGKIINQDGTFSTCIRKGINQVKDWDAFLQESYSTFSDELKKYSNKSSLPSEFYRYDSTRFNYVVVVGRRDDFTEKAYRLRRNLYLDSNIRILHYDNLIEDTCFYIGQTTY